MRKGGGEFCLGGAAEKKISVGKKGNRRRMSLRIQLGRGAKAMLYGSTWKIGRQRRKKKEGKEEPNGEGTYMVKVERKGGKKIAKSPLPYFAKVGVTFLGETRLKRLFWGAGLPKSPKNTQILDKEGRGRISGLRLSWGKARKELVMGGGEGDGVGKRAKRGRDGDQDWPRLRKKSWREGEKKGYRSRFHR